MNIQIEYENLLKKYPNGLTIELLRNREEFRKYSQIRYNWIEITYYNQNLKILDRDDYHFLKTVQYTLTNFMFSQKPLVFSSFIISLIKDYEDNHKCKLC